MQRARHCSQILAGLACLVTFGVTTDSIAAPPCTIEVVDRENGWPVPLVELRTTHDLAFVTDNAGVVALDAPELFNREVWFHVSGHGYTAAKDGFGYRGVRLTPRPGQSLRIEVTRTNIAKRLGRLTGAGLFAESQKIDQQLDWRESGVFGCDSVQSTIYRGRCYWLWGDTDLSHYPLGVFDSTSATTDARPLASFQPPVRLQYDYFVDQKGVPRGVAKIAGEGPTWISAYTSLPDRQGRERLVASYAKIRGPLEAYEVGLCVWNDQTDGFERTLTLWTKSDASPKPPLRPDGHAVRWLDPAGQEWLLCGNPLPSFRCPATLEAWGDPATWERLSSQAAISAVESDAPIEPHSGSIAWNSYRGRWVTVFMQRFGAPSAFGELWYAEADSPTGPWGPAVKILSHDNYTFYNPRLHAEFTDADSPILLFEGTYTTTFADKPAPTPRYDYNQVLYRLDLDDRALQPAQRGRR